jgi:hypothetical protein
MILLRNCGNVYYRQCSKIKLFLRWLHRIALRVTWEWLRRTDPEKPWPELPRLQDEEVATVFDSLVCITVGDGAKTMFWMDRWIHGRAVREIAPMVWDVVRTQCKNKRRVSEAMHNHRWVNDVRGTLNFAGVGQCLDLLDAVCTLERDANSPERFSWSCSATVKYTASSTYRMLCHGLVRWECAKWVWASWAPPKCKFFAWLALKFRLWTSERRYRHITWTQIWQLAILVCKSKTLKATSLSSACMRDGSGWAV